MAAQPGYKSVLYLANAAGALQNIQPYTDNLNVPQTVQTSNVSALGTVAQAFITTLTDGDVIQGSGPYDVTLFTQLTALKAAQAAGSAAAPYIYGPGGSVASQARSAGSVFVTNINPAAQVAGRVEMQWSLQVTGAVSNSTF